MVPFIAGLAVGGLAVFAFSNKQKLGEVAQRGYEKGKEVAEDIKKSALDTAECIKSKVEKNVEEKPQKISTKKSKTQVASG